MNTTNNDFVQRQLDATTAKLSIIVGNMNDETVARELGDSENRALINNLMAIVAENTVELGALRRAFIDLVEALDAEDAEDGE